jgi:hypothetical protein
MLLKYDVVRIAKAVFAIAPPASILASALQPSTFAQLFPILYNTFSVLYL